MNKRTKTLIVKGVIIMSRLGAVGVGCWGRLGFVLGDNLRILC